MAISTKGIQLLNEPGVFEILHKCTREAAWANDGVLADHDGDVVDSGVSGDNYPLTADETVSITNGPTGVDGWDEAASGLLLFGRRFHGVYSGNMQSAVIDSAIATACAAAHTYQLCVKVEWDDFSSERGVAGVAINNAGSGVGTDFIDRISTLQNASGTGGRFAQFTENNDAGSAVYSTDDSVRPGFWQFITVVHTVLNSTQFTTDIYIHTLETNGTVTGGFDSTHTTNRCDTASGTTSSRIVYGRRTLSGTSDKFIGDVALGRLMNFAYSATTVADEAEEFLTTGRLADWLLPVDLGQELFRHEFNERPDLVDEGPLGVHVYGEGDAVLFADALGTGGSLWSMGPNARYVTLLYPAPISLANILGESSPVRANDLFNDSFSAIPEWTIQIWGTRIDTALIRCAEFLDASGESLATNSFQVGVLATGEIYFFGEYAGGTNITEYSTSGTLPVDAAALAKVSLITMRAGEDPSNAGDPLYRVSLDDSIDATSQRVEQNFSGGNSNSGWRSGIEQGAPAQEWYFCTRQLSDTEITDALANVTLGGSSGGGDGVAPTVTVVSPAEGGALTPAGSVVIDVTDADGLAFVELTIVYPGGATEVAFRDGDFRRPYTGTQAAITDGYRYTIDRDGGWPNGNPRFEVVAVDNGGARL